MSWRVPSAAAASELPWAVLPSGSSEMDLSDVLSSEKRNSPLPAPNTTESPAQAATPTHTTPQPTESVSPSQFRAPQFTKSTLDILERMKSKSQGPIPPLRIPTAAFQVTYEDVKRRLMENLKTSSTASETRPGPATLPLPNKSTTSATMADETNLTPGVKRKRDDQDSEREQQVDKDEIPKPGSRKRVVKLEGTMQCETCGKSPWSSEGLIVTCSLCHDSYHTDCHEPAITSSEVEGDDSFNCAVCLKEKSEIEMYEREKLQQECEEQERRNRLREERPEVEASRDERLAALPRFKKPELVGFEAGDASWDTRAEYFSKMKATDLANLLLFADAIQEGLLVDVLASVTGKHPDLPLFNDPDWSMENTATSPPTESATESVTTPPNGQDSPAPKPAVKRIKISAIRKVQGGGPVQEGPVQEVAPVEDILPTLWPRPGQGLYAALQPEQDDSILYDDNDEEAFSGFFVDGRGRQVVEAVVA